MDDTVWPGGPSKIHIPDSVSVFILQDSGVDTSRVRKDARVVVMDVGSTKRLGENVVGYEGPLLRDGVWVLPQLDVPPEQVCVVLRSSLVYDGQWPADYILFQGLQSVGQQWLTQWRLQPMVVGRVCEGDAWTVLCRRKRC